MISRNKIDDVGFLGEVFGEFRGSEPFLVNAMIVVKDNKLKM